MAHSTALTESILGDPAPSVAVCESRSVIWTGHRWTIRIRRYGRVRGPSASPLAAFRMIVMDACLSWGAGLAGQRE
jgi:hypothetical protein